MAGSSQVNERTPFFCQMASNQVQRAWQEEFVFPEMGARIVHYILRDTAKNSLLAVVAIERSYRHMEYFVSADYLREFGSTSTINVETKWTRRQQVVDWLRSLVKNKGPIFPNSSQEITRKTPSLDYLKSSIHLSSYKNAMDGKGSKNSAFENSKIMWSGEAWICDKKLKHFPSYHRRGVKIEAYSFVYVLGENAKEYLAYVKDLYEDQNNLKIVQVRWFNFPTDIEDLTTDIETHPREVFMTPYEQDISAECINGVATILTPNHFDKCLKCLPGFRPSETFLCNREVRNRKIDRFCLPKLHGYSSQGVLSALISHVQKLKLAEGEESEKPRLGQEPQEYLIFNVNDDVEILRHDSGLRGCWYRTKVVGVKQNCIKVQYYDVLEVDGPEKLEEWLPSHRVANPDLLGMRHDGRLMIRPMRSEETGSTKFDTGSAVDAWWSDGWWEGVLLGNEIGSPNNLQLFFPGEKMFRTIERKNIRASRDWIDGEWKNIIPNPNILSSISSILNTTPPLNVPGTISNIQNMERHQGRNDFSAISSETVKPKANKELPYKKQRMSRYREERAANSSDN